MESFNSHINIELGEIEDVCFVAMPFDPLFQTQYERVVRPAVESLGLKCIRGDEIYSKPQIMADIWKAIRKSRLVLAELTNKNPNVFYEVGLAHAIGKPVILLTRNEDDVPFDLKALRYRYYNTNDPFWGENLQDAIRSMIQSVLTESELTMSLEGITAQLHIPDAPKPVDLSNKVSATQIDISGTWKAKYKIPHGFEHEGLIFITQRGAELSATMTVSIKEEQTVSVIQELLIGRVQGEEVTLNGVSYTNIKQGNVESYDLDNFVLKISPERTKMQGKFIDSGADVGRARFIKQ